jgi:acyl-CoA synthetase (AMP-forming)/AMP-acid ligase II
VLVHHFLEYYARNTPDLPCLTQHGKTTSFGEVNALANRVANGLLTLGVEKGQRVAILGENSLQHLLLFMGAGKIGAVTVSLNYRLAPAELGFIIRDSETRALLALEGMQDSMTGLDELLPPETVILTQGNGTELNWEDWLADQADTPPGITVDPQDAFLQLYTSGTTGNPKGVVSSHFNFISLNTMNNIASPSRANAGMAGIVVEDIENHQVCNVFMVPAMIMAILQLPDIEQRDFSKLSQIFYGASPISETVLRRAVEVFECDFIQMYGMTETTGTVVNLTADDHRRALAGKPELLRSCGRPSVGAEVRVVDPEGNELPRGEIGEIWLRADTNMQCYYNLPDATAANLTDGWVHTGDAGYMDEEGYLYLKDRMKDMVVSGGENIYPVEVENALARHESVADVAVIGVPDDKFGEALLATHRRDGGFLPGQDRRVQDSQAVRNRGRVAAQPLR